MVKYTTAACRTSRDGMIALFLPDPYNVLQG